MDKTIGSLWFLLMIAAVPCANRALMAPKRGCPAPEGSYIELDGVVGITGNDTRLKSGDIINPGDYYYTTPCNKCQCLGDGDGAECDDDDILYDDPIDLCIHYHCEDFDIQKDNDSEICDCEEDEVLIVVPYPDCCRCKKQASATTEIADRPTSEPTTVISYRPTTEFAVASTLPSMPGNDDDCSPNPCQNRGVCTPGKWGEFSCRCRCRFTGPLCETKKNPCDSNPCLNGGTCIPGSGTQFTFSCSCNNAFTGSRCETEDGMDPY